MALTVAELRTLFTGDVSDLERAQARAKAGNRAAARDVSTSWTKAGHDSSVGFQRGFNLDRPTKQIDTLSGRLGILLQTATALGPGIVSGATPALAGLVAQAGAVTLGVGATVAAFYGIPDAIKAVNKADLNPTIENARLAKEALAELPVEGRAMVAELRSWAGPLTRLRDIGQQQAFPGMIDGLDGVRSRLPDINRLMDVTASKSGDLFSRVGADLAGERWDRQFNHAIQTTPRLLDDVSSSVGSTVHALAALWVATAPLTAQWSTGFRNATNDFDEWATALEGSSGLANFLDYAQDSGANLVQTLGQVSGAFIDIGRAAAPVSGPLMDTLGAVADAVGAIAGTPFGTPIVAGTLALSAYNKALGMTVKLQSRASARGVGPLGGASGSWRAQLGMLQRLPAAYRTVTLAEKTLTAAQARRTALARRATDARFALIPDGSKRAALRTYMGSVKDVSAAESRLALARQRTSGMWRETALGAGKAAAGAAGFAVAMSPLPDKMGLSNTASLAMMGTLAGPWGAAIGGGIGLVMDLSAANQQLADAERDTTAAIKSGSQERITARLKELQSQRKSLNDGIRGDLADAFNFSAGIARVPLKFKPQGDDKLAKEIKRTKEADAELRASTAATRAALTKTYGRDVARVATMSVEKFSAAVENSMAILSGRAGLRDYEAALDAASQAIKDNGKNLDITTEKGRTNEAALDNIASTALTAADSLNQLNTPMDRLQAARILKRAREDLVDTGVQMGMGQQKAQAFAAKLFALNNARANPKVDVKVAQALGNTRAVWDAINRLHDKKITITTQHVNIETNLVYTKKGRSKAHQQQNIYNPGGKADGGTVGGLAEGGTVPGSRHPYGDSLLTWLAPTEEVTSNRKGQADTFRPELKDINAGMSRAEVARRMLGRGLADGGTVGGRKRGERVRVEGHGLYQVRGNNAHVVARTAAERRAHQLELLTAQQRIRDLRRDLQARGRNRIRGIDRRVANKELEEARAQLRRTRRDTDAKRQAIEEAKSRVEERRLKIAEKREERERALLEKYTAMRDQLLGGAGLFTTGTTSAQQLLRNMKTDQKTGAEWKRVLTQLQDGGLGKGLLKQFTDQGPSAQSLALGKSILAAGNIKELNAAQSGLVAQANQTASTFTPGHKAPQGRQLVNIESFHAGGMSAAEIAQRLEFYATVRR